MADTPKPTKEPRNMVRELREARRALRGMRDRLEMSVMDLQEARREAQKDGSQ